MRESISNTFIFNMVLIFTGILIAMIFGSIVFTRDYKVRNGVITVITKRDGNYTTMANGTEPEIDAFLSSVAYKKREPGFKCPNIEGKGSIYTGNFKICIYRNGTSTVDGGRGNYYTVLTYIYFEFPFIGEFIDFPVKGDSRTFYDLSDR